MATTSETFFIVLAMVMCSILFCITIGVAVALRYCDVDEIDIHELPSVIFERTRDSLNWARNSIFSYHSDYVEVTDDNNRFLTAERTQLHGSSLITV